MKNEMPMPKKVFIVGRNVIAMPLCLAGSSCLRVLLRVPRPSGSSFTHAKRTGSPILDVWYLCAQAEIKSFFAAMSAVCLPQRSQGGDRRAGDMSGGGYAAPIAGSDICGVATVQTVRSN